MPGQKRKSSDDRGGGGGLGLEHSVLQEIRNLSQATQARRVRAKPGLTEYETSGLIPDQSLFVTSLEAAGYYVKKKDKENILTEDQAIFTKKLKDDLTNHFDYPDNVTKILDTLTLWLKDDEVFLIKCLRPTKTATECSSARSQSQVSQILAKDRVCSIVPHRTVY